MFDWITHPLFWVPASVIVLVAAGFVGLMFVNYLLQDRRYARAARAMRVQVTKIQRERCLRTDTGMLPALRDTPDVDDSAQNPELSRAVDGHPVAGVAMPGVSLGTCRVRHQVSKWRPTPYPRKLAS